MSKFNKMWLLLVIVFLYIPFSLEANFTNSIKESYKKVESNLGWDRYIYAWGDRFVPDENRWVAIRSIEKKKGDMGNFWDVPGSGKKVYGPNKPLALWGLKYKFQKSPDADRRYKFLPVWEYTNNSKDYGYYYILSQTGYFVQQPSINRGTQIRLNGRKKYNISSTRNYFQLKNVSTRKCLDVAGHSSKKNGANIQQWSCENPYRARNSDQIWYQTSAGLIVNKATGKCIDVAGNSSTKNGKNISQWSCENPLVKTRTDHAWRFTSLGQIKNKSTGKCIDIAGNSSKKNGANIIQWSCENPRYGPTDHIWKKIFVKYKTTKSKPPKGYDYQWKIKNVGKNQFVFINRKSNLVIDAAGGGKKKGAKLITWNEHGGKNQKWGFVIINNSSEKKSTKNIAKKRANEIVKKSANFTKKAFSSVEKTISKSFNKAIHKSMKILGHGLMEIKKDQKSRTLMLRVGVDNPLDKLMQLKEDTLDKFVKIDMKKFEFKLEGKDKIRLSLINSIASMGHHIDLTVSFLGNWKLTRDGFKIKNLKMDKFTIPLFPNSTTQGIRNSLNKELRRFTVNIKNYPGKSLVKNTSTSKTKFKVLKVKTTRTKSLVKIQF